MLFEMNLADTVRRLSLTARKKTVCGEEDRFFEVSLDLIAV